MEQPEKPLQKKRGSYKRRPPEEILPGRLRKALERGDDFILACETDPETGRRRVHVMTGRFVTACMLRKLIGLAESQRDEGATIWSRDR